jgi:hypothetical protein
VPHSTPAPLALTTSLQRAFSALMNCVRIVRPAIEPVGSHRALSAAAEVVTRLIR